MELFEPIEVRLDVETILTIDNFNFGRFNRKIKEKTKIEEKYEELVEIYKILKQQGLYHPSTVFYTMPSEITTTTVVAAFGYEEFVKQKKDLESETEELEKKLSQYDREIKSLITKIKKFCNLKEVDSNMLIPTHYHIVDDYPYYTHLGIFPISREYFKRHQFNE